MNLVGIARSGEKSIISWCENLEVFAIGDGAYFFEAFIFTPLGQDVSSFISRETF